MQRSISYLFTRAGRHKLDHETIIVPHPMLISYEGQDNELLPIRAKAMVFTDAASRMLLKYLERLAPSDMPVLINGETGTGKELVARHLHKLSRRSGPFLALNCGAISEQLAESELFGHEAGAYTGAAGRRAGWFEAATGGTLFLDEIGDLPLALQTKLLRVIQEKEVVRIGSRKSVAVDVRIIAATNVDLEHEVSAGRFRRDLLYRLNVGVVRLKPLRERAGDIPALAEHFLALSRVKLGRSTCFLSQGALEAMLSYQWPGNIRELENVISFAMLVADDGHILPEHLRIPGGWDAGAWDEAADVRHGTVAGTDDGSALEGLGRQIDRLLKEAPQDSLHRLVEAMLVHRAYASAGRNQVRMAALLGVTRNVARTLLARHGTGAADAAAHTPATQTQRLDG